MSVLTVEVVNNIEVIGCEIEILRFRTMKVRPNENTTISLNNWDKITMSALLQISIKLDGILDSNVEQEVHVK